MFNPSLKNGLYAIIRQETQSLRSFKVSKNLSHMKTPLYREALKHSWHLAWKHKWLWPLGLFATLLGHMGIMEFLTTIGIVDNVATPTQLVFELALDIQGFSYGFLSGLPVAHIAGILWVLITMAVLGVFILFISVVSQGALIHVAARSAKSKSKKAKLPTVDASWHAGTGHFWRLFFIQVFKKMILLTLAIVVGFFASRLPGGTNLDGAAFLGVFFSALIIGLVVSFFVIYAACYVVVEEQSLGQALESAWKLFQNHPIVSLEVGLILIAINYLLVPVVAISIFVFFIPSLILWVVAAVLGSSTLFAAATVVAFVLLAMFIMFVGSLYTVFNVSTWTYLFMKMHKKRVKSRTLHWLGG